MEMKPNNPLLIGAAVLVIFLAIAYIESTKVQMKNEFVGSLDGGNATKQGLFPKAPELSGIEGYINAPEGFTLSDVKGKVVLVDFWTYSCINCIRTLPYLTAWDERYRDDGLVIVGVHTPEFEFEKEYGNVKAAVEKHGIKYPVVLDNGFSTWRAYQNRFWPHKYLIDADGYIRYDHIGEGNYDETEEMIQKLLRERDAKAEMDGLVAENITEKTPTQATTQEKYLGYSFALPRGQNIGNAGGLSPGETTGYALPAAFQSNVVYLEGAWKSEPEYVELASETGKVVLKYRAKNVNIVAEGTSAVSLTLDGSAPAASALGSDARIDGGEAIVEVTEERLYNIVDDEGYFEKTLEMDVSGKGFRLYTFTFG